MKNKSYLIIHGLGGSGHTHWQSWLYNQLKKSNEKVYFPKLPNPDSPNLDEWIISLKETIRNLEGEKYVICHSLGSILWLHYSTLSDVIQVDHLLLVAPPGPKAITDLTNINNFMPIPLNKSNLLMSAKNIRLVCSDSDEYCEEKASIYFGKTLSLKVDLLPDASRHINIDSGYGPWLDVEKWCQNPTYRIKE